MNFVINEENIKIISKVLKKEPEIYENSWTWNLKDPDGNKPLIISIYNNINYIDNNISLVSVQSRYGYYELHSISNFIVIEPDEIIFISNYGENISCLVVGSNFTCSLFSNINKNLLNKDITTLHPAVLMSVMQISITEAILLE